MLEWDLGAALAALDAERSFTAQPPLSRAPSGAALSRTPSFRSAGRQPSLTHASRPSSFSSVLNRSPSGGLGGAGRTTSGTGGIALTPLPSDPAATGGNPQAGELGRSGSGGLGRSRSGSLLARVPSGGALARAASGAAHCLSRGNSGKRGYSRMGGADAAAGDMGEAGASLARGPAVGGRTLEAAAATTGEGVEMQLLGSVGGSSSEQGAVEGDWAGDRGAQQQH